MNKTEGVMFSGGRDSTLVASILMLKEIPVHLITANSGCSVNGYLTKYRVSELRRKFKDLIVDYSTLDISGTFRYVAIESLERDILKYKKNMVVVGEKLALHICLVDFCLRNKIKKISDGLTKYQSHLGDQKQPTIDFLKKFMKHYGIEYDSPIYEMAKTEEDVKYRLMQLGLSTKPLEGSSIFGDTFSEPTEDEVFSYLDEKKELAHKLVDFLTQKNEYK